MGGLGPMLSQANQFVVHNLGKSTHAENDLQPRPRGSIQLSTPRLTGRDYVAGDSAGAIGMGIYQFGHGCNTLTGKN